MTGRRARVWMLAAGALLTCAGCGFKGPLYLPERHATVVTHPAQAAPPAGPAREPAAKKKGPQSQQPQPPQQPQPSPGASPPSPQ